MSDYKIDYCHHDSVTAESRQEYIMPAADVIEVGKPYPREELEKYGLTEWKDKHGQRWVMVERREHEKHIHD